MNVVGLVGKFYLYKSMTYKRSRRLAGKFLNVADHMGFSYLLYPPLLRIFPRDIGLRGRYGLMERQRFLRQLKDLMDSYNYKQMVDADHFYVANRFFDRKSNIDSLFFSANERQISALIQGSSVDIQEVNRKWWSELIFEVCEIETVENMVQQGLAKSKTYLGAKNYGFALPAILPKNSTTEAREVKIPYTAVYTLEEAKVISSAQVLKNDKVVVYEPAANPKNGVVAGTWPYVVNLTNSDRALVFVKATKRKVVPEAILITGRSAKNYFHWVVEYMSRIWTIDQDERFDNVPLIIEKGLFKQCYELLNILNYKKRPIIYIDGRMVLECKTLHIPNYQTNIIDNLKDPYWFTSGISEDHLKFVRERVLSSCGLDVNAKVDKSKRVYVSRANYLGRSLVNEKQIEILLKKEGFEVVYPETMCFRDQVALFNSAGTIISPSGAGLANTLFCREGTNVVGLLSEINHDYCLFSNVANVAGANYYHVLGKNINSRAEGQTQQDYQFGPYKVDVDDILESTKKL